QPNIPRISWPGRVISLRGIISGCQLSMLSGVTITCMGISVSEYLKDKEGVLQGCSPARN
ncbi:hypothetical protein K443DRAFT_675181, partial [Laccaria amethystina LaAM-08-1]